MNHLLAVILLCLATFRGIQLSHSPMEIVNKTNSHCETELHNMQNHLNRKKRYLLFENGAALSVTTAAVKSIVSGVPRGLNVICEESLYYDLPSAILVPKQKLTKVSTNHLKMNRKYFTELSATPQQYKMKQWKRPKRFHENLEKDEIFNNNLSNVEKIFFRQIESLSKWYGYKSQYCIMRTICEAQHFLYPKGHSLFHDVIRIILRYFLPILNSDHKYLKASKVIKNSDCANLYGPHCKISFLEYFTDQIHNDFLKTSDVAIKL